MASFRSEFKVEVPNSGASYQLTSEDSALQQQQYQMLLQQQKHESFILPNGYPGPGGYFIPPNSELYQASLMSTTGGTPSETASEIYPDIWEAVELGDLAAVQRHLINGASPDQRNSSRSTLLHRTAWQGTKPYAVMHLLISYGANVNLTNENGNSVLQNVLMKHDDPALIKLLLDNGAETTIPNKEGMNTLEVAALFNKLDSAKYLLENDVASSDSESILSALQRARSPDKKAMKVLLKSWQGKEGEKKRAELLERQRTPGLHTKHSSQSQVHLHERGLSQHQNTSTSQIHDATSVHSAHSFDTTKDGT
ncbi:ankyrin repeat-containing domain protein [Mortierella sp. GBAus27b]|nr:ankyrin repeat-containing domain protein [Mortierella sp. GBAus27b]